MKIEMGIGWKPDPEKPGYLVSCYIRDYVAEIERLRKALQEILDDPEMTGCEAKAIATRTLGQCVREK